MLTCREATVQPEASKTEKVFAGHTVVRRLGAGGTGQVYLAQHPRLPRRDALKILPSDLTANEEFRQRLLASTTNLPSPGQDSTRNAHHHLPLHPSTAGCAAP
jgi:serine/threonine protein kinase